MCILLTSIIHIFKSIYLGIPWLTANGKIFPVFCMDRYSWELDPYQDPYPEKKKAGIP
jgi:hypothetical protein